MGLCIAQICVVMHIIFYLLWNILSQNPHIKEPKARENKILSNRLTLVFLFTLNQSASFSLQVGSGTFAAQKRSAFYFDDYIHCAEKSSVRQSSCLDQVNTA